MAIRINKASKSVVNQQRKKRAHPKKHMSQSHKNAISKGLKKMHRTGKTSTGKSVKLVQKERAATRKYRSQHGYNK